MQKIECYTLFDITATGINGHAKIAQFPYVSRHGTTIPDAISLSRARNQQRNFDTLLQLIGLRTQVFNVSAPEITDHGPFGNYRTWRFEFDIEPQQQWTVDGDQLWMLKQDSEGTPMIVNLNETADIEPRIVVQGDQPNIIYHA
jgi:hypothetical protein